MSPAKLKIKRVLGGLCASRDRSAARRIVLLYHSIGGRPWSVFEREVRRHIEWLASEAAIVPLMDVFGGRPEPLQVSITFDDGYESLHRLALPVLRDAGAAGAVFLTTNWIAVETRKQSEPARGHYPQERFLLWHEVETLAEAGWTVGSHGAEHPDLSVQAEETVRTELRVSRAAIESALGGCAPVFSYPWGRHTAGVRRLVAEAGYTHAVAGIHGPVTQRSDPYAIPRIDIARDYTFDDFKAIVRGDWDYLGWLQRARAFARA